MYLYINMYELSKKNYILLYFFLKKRGFICIEGKNIRLEEN